VRVGLLVLVVALAVALLFISLWPTHVDRGLDLPSRWPVRLLIEDVRMSRATVYQVVEALANVALYMPLGLLARICLPRLNGWIVIGLGGLTSACFESLQAVLPIDRTPSIADVAANTLGVALGWWIAGQVVRDRMG